MKLRLISGNLRLSERVVDFVEHRKSHLEGLYKMLKWNWPDDEFWSLWHLSRCVGESTTQKIFEKRVRGEWIFLLTLITLEFQITFEKRLVWLYCVRDVKKEERVNLCQWKQKLLSFEDEEILAKEIELKRECFAICRDSS
jgi:hypothetical protein